VADRRAVLLYRGRLDLFRDRDWGRGSRGGCRDGRVLLVRSTASPVGRIEWCGCPNKARARAAVGLGRRQLQG
jgi:hypothetical protein